MCTAGNPADTDPVALWRRYCHYHINDQALGFSLDVSRVRFEEAWLDGMLPVMQKALEAMEALESGAVANLDEQRMVGHYWLRSPERSPDPELERQIRGALMEVDAFADAVRAGSIAGEAGSFVHILHIGIGGSALGPQFLAGALGGKDVGPTLHFIDNTDPEGIAETLQKLEGDLGRTMVVVVSKSGGTPEPRNAALEVAAAYRRAGFDFGRHAVAVTLADSRLDRQAEKEDWLKRFPLWNWVGGRTSAMSVVGLLPLALTGVDIHGVLRGAAAMDVLTRRTEVLANPAAVLALMWHHLGQGRGEKDMVILPYRDRLILLSRYLQQLVMESLGKSLDRRGTRVEQGIAVYGNKGSTDQHAYVQQLRDGIANFFVTFIQVLDDGVEDRVEVEPGITSGDYLCGFLLGTRQALYENGRDSVTITMDRLEPATVGALIALFDRAVGLYAELIDINAYHQPGVEAGKAAAAHVLGVQSAVMAVLTEDKAMAAPEIAGAIGCPEAIETVYRVLEHLAANPESGVQSMAGDTPEAVRFHRCPIAGRPL